MTSPHSNNSNKNKFVKHFPFEVAVSSAEAKLIADDMAENLKYLYRGRALLAGDANVKVGETIYLDNLEQGMSGYWVVLEVSHLFGSGNKNYQMEIILGSDKVGDSSPTAGKNSGKRDFSAELANQSLDAKQPRLTSYSVGVNGGKTDLGVKKAKTIKNVASPSKAPTATKYTPNIYKGEVPDSSQVKRKVTWTST
jgi:hypothetical protein